MGDMSNMMICEMDLPFARKLKGLRTHRNCRGTCCRGRGRIRGRRSERTGRTGTAGKGRVLGDKAGSAGVWFRKLGTEEVLLRLLRRFPNLLELRTPCYGNVDEGKVTALLWVLMKRCCSPCLRVIEHPVVLPSAPTLELIRELQSSGRLPELQNLQLKPDFDAAALDVDEEGESELLAKALAEGVEARSALGLPGLRDVGFAHGWDQTGDAVERIYQASFSTLRELRGTCQGDIQALAELLAERAGQEGADAHVGLERLVIHVYVSGGVVKDMETIMRALESGITPQLKTIDLEVSLIRRSFFLSLLAAAVAAKALPELQDFRLHCDTIDGPEDLSEEFALLMQSLEHAPKLRRLQLQGNQYMEADFRPFLKALQAGAYPALKVLDLAD